MHTAKKVVAKAMATIPQNRACGKKKTKGSSRNSKHCAVMMQERLVPTAVPRTSDEKMRLYYSYMKTRMP